MEMTLKNKERYERTMNAYSCMNNIAGVLFIIRKESIYHAICRAMKAIYYIGPKVHVFTLGTWQSNPEEALEHIKESLCKPSATSA